MAENTTTNHISWVCDPCGRQLGTRIPTAATWHAGTCDVCIHEGVPVTEARDYGVSEKISDNTGHHNSYDQSSLVDARVNSTLAEENVPYFKRFTKEPGNNWLVTVKVTTTMKVTVYGGNESRARAEAELAAREDDADIVDVVHIDKI